jgi:hypothetical protein
MMQSRNWFGNSFYHYAAPVCQVTTTLFAGIPARQALKGLGLRQWGLVFTRMTFEFGLVRFPL